MGASSKSSSISENATVGSVSEVEWTCNPLDSLAGCSDKKCGVNRINDWHRISLNKKGIKLSKNGRIYGPVTRTKLDLMGIRFVDDPTDASNGAGDIVIDPVIEPVVDPVIDSVNSDPAAAPDISVYQSKIDELNNAIAADRTKHGEELASKDAEITRLKAVNYDLLISAPDDVSSIKMTDPNNPSGAKNINIDDLFERKSK